MRRWIYYIISILVFVNVNTYSTDEFFLTKDESESIFNCCKKFSNKYTGKYPEYTYDYRSRLSPWDNFDYQKFNISRPILPTDSSITIFSSSGVEFLINASDCEKIAEHTIRYQNIVRNKILPPDYRDMVINDSKTIIKIRQIYGKECTDLFSNMQSTFLMLYLYPQINVIIKDNQYKITSFQHTGSFGQLEKEIICEKMSNGLYGFKFRYMNPLNQGIDFGLFFVNSNAFSTEYLQEKIIATFKVEQIIKTFGSW